MNDYTLSTTLERPYDDTVADVRAALVDAGFGVLTEIDVRATMKNKLDVDVPPQVILGACRPQLAHEAMSAEPSIAALLPCNVVVRSVDERHTVVEAIDPAAMMRVADNDALDRVAEEVHERLTGALGSLGAEAQG
ncbi:MAG TPA: DUF302 domain-containing protein [Marmoricola sp.]|nr:DUF302 domain-containing protein [Marmoricola sp.]